MRNLSIQWVFLNNLIFQLFNHFTQALATARAAFPQARLAWVEAPGAAGGVVPVRLQQPGDPSRRFPHSYAYVDPYSGALLATRDRERFGTGDRVNNWLHPLHDGSAGGLGLRVLLVLAGLLPALLFVTGCWRWRVRARARQAALSRPRGSTAAAPR